MVFIICERTYALRTNVVMPQDLVDAIIQNKPYSGGKHSVLARILDFAEDHEHDEDAVKAFARLEINRMERGIPYLDVIYAAGPLLGLTGTVTGLLRVFSQIIADTGLPDPVAFTKGVALALSATVIGLSVAIPALVGRRIFAAQGGELCRENRFAAGADQQPPIEHPRGPRRCGCVRP